MRELLLMPASLSSRDVDWYSVALQKQVASGQGCISPAQQAPRPAATLSEQRQGAAAVAADIPAATPAPLEGQAKQRLLERLARGKGLRSMHVQWKLFPAS